MMARAFAARSGTGGVRVIVGIVTDTRTVVAGPGNRAPPPRSSGLEHVGLQFLEFAFTQTRLPDDRTKRSGWDVAWMVGYGGSHPRVRVVPDFMTSRGGTVELKPGGAQLSHEFPVRHATTVTGTTACTA